MMDQKWSQIWWFGFIFPVSVSDLTEDLGEFLKTFLGCFQIARSFLPHKFGFLIPCFFDQSLLICGYTTALSSCLSMAILLCLYVPFTFLLICLLSPLLFPFLFFLFSSLPFFLSHSLSISIFLSPLFLSPFLSLSLSLSLSLFLLD